MKTPYLLLATLLACGGDDAGDTCKRVGESLCERAMECGLVEPAELDWCVDEYRRQCTVLLGDDQVDACEAGLAGFDCDELAAGETPPECGR